MAAELTFHPYARSGLFEHVTGKQNGRAVVSVDLTLRDTLSGAVRAEPLVLHLMGPADTAGLQASAIAGTAPKPWTRDAETTKLVHVDFTDIDLPWRYSFELSRNGADQPRPWLVLITGTTEELELAGSMVKIKKNDVLRAHDLGSSWLWAHQMSDAGRQVSRLLSPRGLEGPGLLPNREYLAVVVPAYALVSGQVVDAWEVGPGDQLRAPEGGVLPAYFSWQYWTTGAGDFETLAAQLHAVEVGGLGRARLSYERVPDEDPLEVRGAITSLAADPGLAVGPIAGVATTWPVATDPAPPDILADLQAVTTRLVDPRRKVIGLPVYGIPWIDEPAATDWGRLLNGDPRFRGIAGLGAWLAIQTQEELVDAARQQLGALAEAGQRVRQLLLGLTAARSLWKRRLPADPRNRLVLLGPTLDRLPATDGAASGVSALSLVTGAGRSLPAAALSTAARRTFRPGDGIGKHADPACSDRGAIMDAANACLPAPPATPGGLDDLLRDLGLPGLDRLLGLDDLPEQVRQVIDEVVERGEPIGADQLAERLYGALRDALDVGDWVFPRLRERLAPYDGNVVTRPQLIEVVEPFLVRRDPHGDHGAEDPITGVLDHRTHGAERRCRPVDLGRLAEVATRAIDPLGPGAPAIGRVAATIGGLDITGLEPPEVCIGLNYEVWKPLRDYAKPWLLPGIEKLEADAVVAMETNPAFVDALLTGLNTQLLAELRWRNLAIAPHCTPLRWFWGNFDYRTDSRVDDIRGLHLWQDTRLGDNSHQVLDPGDPAGNRDLVMVFRTDLFRRYPSTLVYLTRQDDEGALTLEQPDFAGRRAIAPKIKGAIGADVTFFIFDIDPTDLPQYRVVLDEPPAELRFRNDLGANAANGGAFAATVIDTPTRVAIDGSYLNWKGLEG
ncbi:hypothetical protein GCM10009841_29010 [Microlunatus panaciterrae]|uniref:Uncharacterized protein n=1 Tax=Microlunatus panaciterrae TaxID=400768 RepID=A0ABS2REY5_9ACTN|nr:hypothetical protein [Microlunatus panaciterrae]MBM7797561.1 hypothetical protein [Microlunatus panaciterrae]